MEGLGLSHYNFDQEKFYNSRMLAHQYVDADGNKKQGLTQAECYQLNIA